MLAFFKLYIYIYSNEYKTNPTQTPEIKRKVYIINYNKLEI